MIKSVISLIISNMLSTFSLKGWDKTKNIVIYMLINSKILP